MCVCLIMASVVSVHVCVDCDLKKDAVRNYSVLFGNCTFLFVGGVLDGPKTSNGNAVDSSKKAKEANKGV